MESAENEPGPFDVYVRRLGKLSTGFSGLLAAVWLFVRCGGMIASLYSIAQLLLVAAILWTPLLWRRLKKKTLDDVSANWALIASASALAVLVLSMAFDSSGGDGCSR